jgi:ammonium transporter, Amt family
MASFVTTLAASFAAIAWIAVDYIYTQKISPIGFCSGAVTGLVAITPAAGFVSPWGSCVIGILSGVLVNFCCGIKKKIGFDDTLDAFAVRKVL